MIRKKGGDSMGLAVVVGAGFLALACLYLVIIGLEAVGR